MTFSLEDRLSDEQVSELLARYLATNDAEAKDAIVRQYVGLVESIARRFSNSGEPAEDLIQEGYIGLIASLDYYDPSKGAKFSTFATHFIIGQIKHALRDRGKLIKAPAWLQELNHKMDRVIESLFQELGRQPTNAEIGRAMRLPEEYVAELLTTREVFKLIPLEGEQDETSFGADIEKVSDERYTVFELPVEDKVVLETAMDKLKLIEYKVIREFYFNGLNQTEIAKALGISCNYVSHILRSATRKLRRILTTEEMRELQLRLQAASRYPNYVGYAESEDVDSLTNLYSESYMRRRLQEELTRAISASSQVACAIVRVDGLEEFGVRHGAMYRDDVLCALARIVKQSVRRCDIVGRLPGCEFVLILLYAGSYTPMVCGRVVEAVNATRFDVGQSLPQVCFTAHAGWAIFPKDGTNASDLFTAARHALDNLLDEVRRAA